MTVASPEFRKQLLRPLHRGVIAWFAVIAFVSLVAFVAGAKRMIGHGHGRDEINRMVLARLSDEAFSIWQRTHATGCPDPRDPSYLAPVDLKDSHDVWGTPIQLACGANWIVVSSAGEDAAFGTADDVVVFNRNDIGARP